MKKKVLSVILSTAMILGLLSGCGSKNETSGQEAQPAGCQEEEKQEGTENRTSGTQPAENFMQPPAEAPQAPAEKRWISFAALLSTEDALALKEFFSSRHIEFKAV